MIANRWSLDILPIREGPLRPTAGTPSVRFGRMNPDYRELLSVHNADSHVRSDQQKSGFWGWQEKKA